ncbi:MAG: cytochrome c maturation protein CcmE [Alphaproteobacteria bacterium]|nr:cytochrome c maturation protein CcmE [Alphaproteobacteria bacterium]
MKKPKLKRTLTLLTLLSSISIGLWIVMSSLNENITFFYTPTELLSKNLLKRDIKVGGIVKPGTIKKLHHNGKHKIVFTITDCINDIDIHYHGILPSLFREGQGIVSVGRIKDSKIFIAEKLLAKHDENYAPKKPINSANDTFLCNPKNFKK